MAVRPKQIKARLSLAEYTAARQFVQAQGITLATLVRRLLAEAVLKRS